MSRFPLSLTSAALAVAAFATSAEADVAEAVRDQLQPGYAAFARSTAALDASAAVNCDLDALRPLYQTAYDDWMAVSFMRIGPGEEGGRTLAIAFWPDPKGMGAKAQRALMEAKNPAVNDPAKFAEISIAARGLGGLERLLYPEAQPADMDYACALTRATARDLARMAAEIDAGWADYARTLTEPGAGGPYQDATEARQALLTQLAAGIEFVAEQRLGRPMGTFDKPRPDRAEAKASGRSLRNVVLSLKALKSFAAALSPDSAATLAAFDRAIGRAETIDDPDFAGVADPQRRLKLEILQGAVRDIGEKAKAEMTRALGAGIGFNSADGD